MYINIYHAKNAVMADGIEEGHLCRTLDEAKEEAANRATRNGGWDCRYVGTLCGGLGQNPSAEIATYVALVQDALAWCTGQRLSPESIEEAIEWYGNSNHVARYGA